MDRVSWQPHVRSQQKIQARQQAYQQSRRKDAPETDASPARAQQAASPKNAAARAEAPKTGGKSAVKPQQAAHSAYTAYGCRCGMCLALTQPHLQNLIIKTGNGAGRQPAPAAQAVDEKTGAPVSGDRLVFDKGASIDTINKVKRLAKALPSNVREFLADNNVTIEVVKDLGELGKIPGFGGAAGIYLFQENVIRIPEKVFNESNQLVPNDFINLKLLTHEASHAIDRQLGEKLKIQGTDGYPPMLNFRNDIRAAFKKDLANLSKTVTDSTERSILEYLTRTTGPGGENRARVEATADTMAAIINGQSSRPKELVLRAFPNLAKLLRTALKRNGITGRAVDDDGATTQKKKRPVTVQDVLRDAQRAVQGQDGLQDTISNVVQGTRNGQPGRGIIKPDAINKVVTGKQPNRVNDVVTGKVNQDILRRVLGS